MAFNPDTYLSKKTSQTNGFNPDNYLSKKQVSPATVPLQQNPMTAMDRFSQMPVSELGGISSVKPYEVNQAQIGNDAARNLQLDSRILDIAMKSQSPLLETEIKDVLRSTLQTNTNLTPEQETYVLANRQSILDKKRSDLAKTKGKIGLVENIAEKFDIMDIVPVLPSKNDKELARQVLPLVWKSVNGQELSLSEKVYLQNYQNLIDEDSERGKTFWSQVYDVGMQAPGFMGQFVTLSGLVGNPTKAAVMTAMRKAMPKLAKTTAGRIGTQVAGNIASGTAMAAADVLGTSTGALQNFASGKSVGKSIYDSFVNQAAEYSSEQMGSVINKLGGKFVKKLIPEGSKLAAKLASMSDSEIVKKVNYGLKQTGYNGTLGEMGEERFGDVMRSAFGIQSWEDAIPSPQQLGVEAVAFTIPGLVAKGGGLAMDKAFGKGGNIIQPKTGAVQNEDGSISVEYNTPEEALKAQEQIVAEAERVKSSGKVEVEGAKVTFTPPIAQTQTPQAPVEQPAGQPESPVAGQEAAIPAQTTTMPDLTKLPAVNEQIGKLKAQIINAGRSEKEADAVLTLFKQVADTEAKRTGIGTDKVLERYGLLIQKMNPQEFNQILDNTLAKVKEEEVVSPVKETPVMPIQPPTAPVTVESNVAGEEYAIPEEPVTPVEKIADTEEIVAKGIRAAKDLGGQVPQKLVNKADKALQERGLAPIDKKVNKANNAYFKELFSGERKPLSGDTYTLPNNSKLEVSKVGEQLQDGSYPVEVNLIGKKKGRVFDIYADGSKWKPVTPKADVPTVPVSNKPAQDVTLAPESKISEPILSDEGSKVKDKEETPSNDRQMTVKQEKKTETLESPIKTPGAVRINEVKGDPKAFKIKSPEGATVTAWRGDRDFPYAKVKATMGEIWYVEVPQADRRKGIGTSLAEDAIRDMRLNGATSIKMNAVSREGRALVKKLIQNGVIGKIIRSSESGAVEYEITQGDLPFEMASPAVKQEPVIKESLTTEKPVTEKPVEVPAEVKAKAKQEPERLWEQSGRYSFKRTVGKKAVYIMPVFNYTNTKLGYKVEISDIKDGALVNSIQHQTLFDLESAKAYGNELLKGEEQWQTNKTNIKPTVKENLTVPDDVKAKAQKVADKSGKSVYVVQKNGKYAVRATEPKGVESVKVEPNKEVAPVSEAKGEQVSPKQERINKIVNDKINKIEKEATVLEERSVKTDTSKMTVKEIDSGVKDGTVKAWQLTKKQVMSHIQRTDKKEKQKSPYYEMHPNAAFEFHKNVIQKALSENKPVPLAVLQDYAGEEWADAAIAKLQGKEQKAEPVVEEVREVNKPKSKIDDFGEKLEGARKDYASKMEKAKDLDIATNSLDKVFPEPDYQEMIDKGVNPFFVNIARAARDNVPQKPRKAYKIKGYVQNVEKLRTFAQDAIDGKYTQEEIENAFKKLTGASQALMEGAEMYDIFGHNQSLAGYRIHKAHFSMYKGEKDVSKWLVEKSKTQGGYSFASPVVEADTKEDAIAKFKDILEGDKLPTKTKGTTQFTVYHYKRAGSKYYIGAKIGGKTVDLMEFNAADDAMLYRKNHNAELLEMVKQFKDVPELRKSENKPRTGRDRRNGKDVTPEMFTSAFGFRGVQFGNWVGKSGERQQMLNDAYDALFDLAEMLNLPTQSLSLNGKLGLAFGARGTGGIEAAAAHYEPDKVVINLTRMKGAGSLAHEWWHALDNYLSKVSGNKSGHLTDNYFNLGTETKLNQKIINGFKTLMAAIRKTGLPKRSENLDTHRSKPYWQKDIEMTARVFENYVRFKMEQAGYSNDYLSNIKNKNDFARDMVNAILSGEKVTAEEMWPYLTESEVKDIIPVLDSIFVDISQDSMLFNPNILYQSAAEAGVKPSLVEKAKAAWLKLGTESPYFKAWFGKSKVVDADGKPLVVYHGTAVNFDTFSEEELGRTTNAESAKKGFFFSDNPYDSGSYVMSALISKDGHATLTFADVLLNSSNAQYVRNMVSGYKPMYDDAEAEAYKILPKYRELTKKYSDIDSILNYINSVLPIPLKVSEEKTKISGEFDVDVFLGRMLVGRKWTSSQYKSEMIFDSFKEKYEKLQNGLAGYLFAEKIGTPVMAVYLKAEKPKILDNSIRKIKIAESSSMKKGTDSTNFKNISDPLRSNHWIVYDPTQIKSVSNQGTFNSENPNILYQSAVNQTNLPKRSSKYGVGKAIGTKVYVHKQYEGVFSGVESAKSKLPKGFDYDIVAYDESTGSFTFSKTDDWNNNPEPAITEQVIVKDGVAKSIKQSVDPWIYHHKYLFVKDNYTGFDVEESKNRSRAWINLPVDKSRIGKKSYWESNVVPLIGNNILFQSAITDEDIAIANSTSRGGGSVGANALVPRMVRQFINKDTSILDFGAGKIAQHAESLKQDGYNVTAYEFGTNINPKLHDKDALSRQYDVVYASNVINVQNSEAMLESTIDQIYNATKDGGVVILNLPSSPRKGAYAQFATDRQAADYLQGKLSEKFNSIKRIGGTASAPVFIMAKGAVKNNVLLQSNQSGNRGSIEFTDEGAIITVMENADASTLVHELGHLFLRDMVANDHPDVPAIRKWVGNKGEPFTREQEEKFARGWEAYLRRGKAPAPFLQRVFDDFKGWLKKVYKTAKDLDIKLNKDIIGVFDRMLGGVQEAKTEEAPVPQVSESKIEAEANKVPDVEPEAENPNYLSPKHAVVLRELKEYFGDTTGLVPNDGSRAWIEDVKIAFEQNIKDRALRIASEMLATGRDLTMPERAGLLIKAIELKKEHSALIEKRNATTDDVEFSSVSIEMDRVLEEYQLILRALYQANRQAGRALNFGKLTMAIEDFSLISVLSEAKHAKGDKELTESERAKIEQLVTEYDQLVDKYDGAKEALAKLQTQYDELRAKYNVKQGSVSRYRSMTVEQKDVELTDLISQTKTLLEEGCYNG